MTTLFDHSYTFKHMADCGRYFDQHGIRLAFWLAVGGMVVSLLAALTLPRKASGTGL